MVSVFKYQFEIVDDVSVEMPIGAKVLHVEDQRGAACLWALVDPEATKEVRCFRLAGTGHPIDPATIGEHVATWQSGPFVWHLFEAR
jgi:hypothetical protein